MPVEQWWYKHIGGQTDASGGVRKELKARGAATMQAYLTSAKKIVGNQDLPLLVRQRAVATLCGFKVLYISHVWLVVADQQWVYVNKVWMHMHRTLLQLHHHQVDVLVTDAQVLKAAGALTLQQEVSLRRLSVLRRLVLRSPRLAAASFLLLPPTHVCYNSVLNTWL